MLHIYNTFSQKKEPFKPLKPGEISLYVCGITVYDYCHLGHARVFVAFDAIVRFLRASGWKVTYVRNITDIDDKIIKRAQENNEKIQDLTHRFITAMNEDTAALNVTAPDQEPRATEYIEQIIHMVKQLEDKHYAYQAANGDIYFAVEKFASYGQLAHKNLEQLQQGARVEVVEEKRSPLDFVLWKKAKSGEPSWPSPWGQGRPGWHIECSAMSTHCLGETFDLHGGGADLAFPHHENERAQSECATNQTFVNTWLHVGFVQVNKEKMSKSLGNFFTIREILKTYDAEVVRYLLLASHYRSPLNYSTEQLDQAKHALERLYTALRGVKLADNLSFEQDLYWQRFFAAMNDDFNTPVAIAVLFEVVTALNNAREQDDLVQVTTLATLLKKMANILGILTRDPAEFLQGKVEDIAAIEQLIAQREEARRTKNWPLADELRQKLTTLGIALEDTADGTIWRKL